MGRPVRVLKGEYCFFHPRDPRRGPIRSTLSRQALRTIVTAILEAWRELETFDYWKSERFEPKHLFDEDELSTKLVEILNDKLANNRGGHFRKEVFQTVVRDAKQANARATSYDQMPDLTFRMVQSAPGEDADESALFVEAKLVSAEERCRQYVVEGLYRFVSGKYAPRVTFGMMLGYATPDYNDPSARLREYYVRATSPEALQCRAVVVPSNIHDECLASEHQRERPCAPQFRALHLWLVRATVQSARLTGETSCRMGDTTTGS